MEVWTPYTEVNLSCSWFGLRSDGSEEEIQADLIVGCDGAFSAIRKQFLRRSRFNFSQTYIPHGYMELTMPPINGEVSLQSVYHPPFYLRWWDAAGIKATVFIKHQSRCVFLLISILFCHTSIIDRSSPWNLIICTSGHETHSWWSPCPTWWVCIYFPLPCVSYLLPAGLITSHFLASTNCYRKTNV